MSENGNNNYIKSFYETFQASIAILKQIDEINKEYSYFIKQPDFEKFEAYSILMKMKTLKCDLDINLNKIREVIENFQMLFKEFNEITKYYSSICINLPFIQEDQNLDNDLNSDIDDDYSDKRMDPSDITQKELFNIFNSGSPEDIEKTLQDLINLSNEDNEQNLNEEDAEEGPEVLLDSTKES